MKKAILGCGVAALLLAAAACEKDRTQPPVVPNTNNMWRVGNTTYTAESTEGSMAGSGQFEVVAATHTAQGIAGITFIFPTATTPDAGAYLAVTNFSGVGNEVKVITQNDNGLSIVQYNTTGYDSIRATVTVDTANRVTINLPAAWALNQANAADSVRVSATGIMQH